MTLKIIITNEITKNGYANVLNLLMYFKYKNKILYK